MKHDKYGLLESDVINLRKQYPRCAYCQKPIRNPDPDIRRGDWATIEHLNRKAPWNNIDFVVICCGSCNSSRRDRKLLDWFDTQYCKQKHININTVAEKVKEYIRNHKTEEI